MKHSDAGTAGHTRSPICRGLTAGFLGEMGKNQAHKSLSREDCLPYFAGQNGFPHHKQGRLFFTLTLNSAAPVPIKQHPDSLGISTV